MAKSIRSIIPINGTTPVKTTKDTKSGKSCKSKTARRAAKLPGAIYLNKNRYWWKVKLPGEPSPSGRSAAIRDVLQYACGVRRSRRLVLARQSGLKRIKSEIEMSC